MIKFAFSEVTFNELCKIVSDKVVKHNLFECGELFQHLVAIKNRSIFIPLASKLPKLSSDKGDQFFIELADHVKAKYLITNDKSNGLLELGNYNNVGILTPSQYLKEISKFQRNR